MPCRRPALEHLQDLRHLPEFERLEIQHFFEVYKDLEPGKSVEGADWVDRAAAEAEIQASRDRAVTHDAAAAGAAGATDDEAVSAAD